MSLLLVLGVSTCQSGPAMPAEAAQALPGCWIEYRDKGAVTFRWFEDRQNRGQWLGNQTDYFLAPQAAVQGATWKIAQNRHRARLCLVETESAPLRCWPLRFDDPPKASAQDAAIVRVKDDALLIYFIESGTRRVLFAGGRDGCD